MFILCCKFDFSRKKEKLRESEMGTGRLGVQMEGFFIHWFTLLMATTVRLDQAKARIQKFKIQEFDYLDHLLLPSQEH